MSTISGIAERRPRPCSGILAALAGATKRLFLAYVTWRIEQCVAILRSMSVEELSDRVSPLESVGEAGSQAGVHLPALQGQRRPTIARLHAVPCEEGILVFCRMRRVVRRFRKG